MRRLKRKRQKINPHLANKFYKKIEAEDITIVKFHSENIDSVSYPYFVGMLNGSYAISKTVENIIKIYVGEK